MSSSVDLAQLLTTLERRVGPSSRIRPPTAIIPSGTHAVSGPVMLAGPWVGELGVGAIRWAPYLRALSMENPDTPLVASGYANHYPLYADFCAEYWVVPQEYEGTLRNEEPPLNYGSFHELIPDSGHREEAARKGLPDRSAFHAEIALQWVREAWRRNLSVVRLIDVLGAQRAFVELRAEDTYRRRAVELAARRGISLPDRALILMLPRRRRVQADLRSWDADVYREVVRRLVREHGLAVGVLGSDEHEAELSGLGDDLPGVVNLIGEGLQQQLAFWECAALATGPPSGGLVPAYLTRTPLLHWFKPGRFPQRHGHRWDEYAEPDYQVFGVRSTWCEVADDSDGVDTAVAEVVRRVGLPDVGADRRGSTGRPA